MIRLANPDNTHIRYEDTNKRDDIPRLSDDIEIEREGPSNNNNNNNEMANLGSPLRDKNSQLNDDKMDSMSFDNALRKESVAESKPTIQEGNYCWLF